jgi:alginate O-acetyltransferase complex protein AlgI
MVFSSSLFIFGFLPVFFTAYFMASQRFKNVVIIIGSLFFYAWGARSFVLIVLGTGIVDYTLGSVIFALRNNAEKRVLYHLSIAADVILNIGILAYFKYTNFFVANINRLFSGIGLEPLAVTAIVLPVGISFVVFQKVTYCLDIAKGTALPAGHFWEYIEYLLVFPQIIAGPIVKYNVLRAQIEHRIINKALLVYGFQRFSIGLFKKVWIADVLAKYADLAFNGSSTAIPIHYVWFGALCYAFQIYFDFSAYSDMAIGMLKIMGFSIPENFDNPYISKSISEFWKRWHISLTSWMREYLYIPIGGNRKGVARTYLNQWLVFLVSGLWHGARWNFVFWGIYHGTLLCLEKIILLKVFRKIPGFIRMGMTFIAVLLGWVFFRADGFIQGTQYLRQMFNFGSVSMHVDPFRIMVVDNRGIFVFILAVVLSFLPYFEKLYAKLQKTGNKIKCTLCFLLFCLSVLKVGTASFSPFIYFKF